MQTYIQTNTLSLPFSPSLSRSLPRSRSLSLALAPSLSLSCSLSFPDPPSLSPCTTPTVSLALSRFPSLPFSHSRWWRQLRKQLPCIQVRGLWEFLWMIRCPPNPVLCCRLQVWHDSFIPVFWRIHVRDMTHSCVVMMCTLNSVLCCRLQVWQDSFIPVCWRIHVRDMTHPCVVMMCTLNHVLSRRLQVWQDSFIPVFWCIHVRDKTHSCVVMLCTSNHICCCRLQVWQDLPVHIYKFVDVRKFVGCKSFYGWFYVFRITFAAAGCRCDMTHLYICVDAFLRVTWPTRTRAVTHSCMGHDSFACGHPTLKMCSVTEHVWGFWSCLLTPHTCVGVGCLILSSDTQHMFCHPTHFHFNTLHTFWRSTHRVCCLTCGYIFSHPTHPPHLHLLTPCTPYIVILCAHIYVFCCKLQVWQDLSIRMFWRIRMCDMIRSRVMIMYA